MFSQLNKAALLVVVLWADSMGFFKPGSGASLDRTSEIDNHIGNEGSIRSIDQRLHSLDVRVKAIDKYLKSEFEVLKQLAANISKPKECPPGFQYLSGPNSCYFVFWEPLTWFTAVERCQEKYEGAYMATITTAAEQLSVSNFMYQQLLGKSLTNKWGDRTWIAGKRVADDCNATFAWKPTSETTIPMTYTNWYIHEPNCFDGNEYCVHLQPGTTYQWNDRNCNDSLITLCEYGPL